MNRKAWAIFDFSVAACNAACGGVSLHDGRIGSAVVSFKTVKTDWKITSSHTVI